MTLTRSNSLLITIGFIVLAVVCYVIGMVLPGTVFLVVGAVFEMLVWLRVLRRR